MQYGRTFAYKEVGLKVMGNLLRSRSGTNALTPSRLPSFLVIPLLIVASTVGCSTVAHPPDRAMEERLRERQSDFDKLIGMLKEDSDVVRLGYDFVFFNNGTSRDIPTERMGEYRRLFDQLDLRNGVHRDRDNVIRLIASSRDGILIKSEKSYVYSTVDLSPRVDSLDNVIKTDRGDRAPVFKKVADNWYLYYESW